MPNEGGARDKARWFIPVVTFGNLVSALCTAAPICVAVLIWGTRIDERVGHLADEISAAAPASSLIELDRRISTVENDARASAVTSAAIREQLGVMTGEQRAQRVLLETLVNRGSRGDGTRP